MTEEPSLSADTPYEGLLTLLSVNGYRAGTWSDAELRDMLRHQMATLCYSDLVEHDPAEAEQVRRLLAEADPPIETFSDLLSHDRPPQPLLRRVKEFAKSCRGDPDGDLPEGITAVLYFGSLLSARRAGHRISRITDAELRNGLLWVLAQPWLDDALRERFEAGLRWLEPGADG